MMYGLQLPKPVRETDPNYLGFVRSLTCSVCNAMSADAHHLTTRGAGGSDYTAIPLCRNHHQYLHTVGQLRFEEEYGVSLWAINSASLRGYISTLSVGDR